MFLRIFYKYNWYTPLLFLLGGLLLWRNAFLNTDAVMAFTGEHNGPLFDLALYFFRNHPLTAVIFSFAAAMFQVFFITHLSSSKVMKNRHSAIAGLILLLLISSRPFMTAVQPGHFSGVFLLLAINKILDIYEDKDIIPQIFHAGLHISLAGLFYYPAWAFFFLLIFSLFIYYVVSARALMAAVTGFLMPLFFLFTILWVTDQLDTALGSFARYQQTWMSPDLPLSLYNRVYIYVLAFLSIISLFSLRLLYMPSKAIRTRQRMKTLSIAIIIALLSYLMAGKHLPVNHSLLVLPLAVSLAVLFEGTGKKTFSEILFLLLAAVLVAGNIMP